MNNSTGGTALKVDLIKDAYSQMRISGLTVQPTPEDLELALNRLENMAAEWQERNISAGYHFEDEPDPNTDSYLKRAYWQAFSTNLGVRLLNDFGKSSSPESAGLMKQASQSLSAISGIIARDTLNQVSYPDRQPTGSGNHWNRWWRYYRTKPTSQSIIMMIEGDIADFTEHFDSWLNLQENEAIDSYSIQSSSGRLIIESDSNTDVDVLYRLKAESPSNQEQITIIVDTTAGRRETRYSHYQIQRVT